MANTKRALLLSVVSIFLCVVMLAGTTFAWFTDSVESTGNIIKTGSLKIDLYNDEGKSLKENPGLKFFDYSLWEPGYTQAEGMKLVNKGNLHFKYQLMLIPTGAYVTKLADVIDVYVLDSAADRTALTGSIGTLAEVLNNKGGVLISGTTAGLDMANTTDIFNKVIVFKMQESAGNEYQNMSLIDGGFSVKLLATQLTAESDSFNDQYDKDSKYDPIPVKVTEETTFTEITDLFAAGKSITTYEDITISNGTARTEIEINDDITIYASDDATISMPKLTLITGDGTLTIDGGKLDMDQELCVTDNSTLIINGGVHDLNAFSATENGKIIINNGTVNCYGTYAGILGISFAENGSLKINGGTVNLYEPINLNANRCDNVYVEINGGEINLLNGADKLFAVRDIMDKDRTSGVLRGSSVKITGGTFTTTYQLDSDGDANAFIRNEDTPDTHRVLVSNTYNGQPDYNCVVTGGTFYGCWQRSDNNRGGTGGVVANTIAGFVAPGYSITGDETNGYVVA